ncbi:MAG: hypothetical protein AB1782_05745 [Cyanobacteriota bacterium]
MSLSVNSQSLFINPVSSNINSKTFSPPIKQLNYDQVSFTAKRKRHPIRNGLLGLGALLTVVTAPLTGCKPNDSNAVKAPPPTVAEQTVNNLQRVDKDFVVNQDNSKVPLNAEKLANYVYKLAQSTSSLAERHNMELMGVVVADFGTKTIPSDYSQDVVATYAEKSDINSENLIAVPARILQVKADENGEPVLKVINFIYGKDNTNLSRDIARINESLKDVDPSNPACNEGGSFALGVGTGMLLSD